MDLVQERDALARVRVHTYRAEHSGRFIAGKIGRSVHIGTGTMPPKKQQGKPSRFPLRAPFAVSFPSCIPYAHNYDSFLTAAAAPGPMPACQAMDADTILVTAEVDLGFLKADALELRANLGMSGSAGAHSACIRILVTCFERLLGCNRDPTVCESSLQSANDSPCPHTCAVYVRHAATQLANKIQRLSDCHPAELVPSALQVSLLYPLSYLLSASQLAHPTPASRALTSGTWSYHCGIRNSVLLRARQHLLSDQEDIRTCLQSVYRSLILPFQPNRRLLCAMRTG